MLPFSPTSWLAFPHVVSCLSWGMLRNLSRRVCLVTSRLANKHFGKDYFSVAVHNSYQALLKLTDPSAKRIATQFLCVCLSPALIQTSEQKGFSHQLLLARDFPAAPPSRCCPDSWSYSQNRQHQHNFPRLNLLSHASALLWRNIFDVKGHWCHWDWPRGNSPGDLSIRSLHQLLSKPCPDWALCPDEAESIWGPAKAILWVYPMLLSAKKSQWHMQKSSRGQEPFLPSLYDGRRQHQEGSSPSCMHTCTKAAEPLRESQQEKGAGVSCISSERRADLPTQGGEPGRWKPPGIEILSHHP